MIAYFNPPNAIAALAIAKAFGLTRIDGDGVERITSTHEGSAIWGHFGDGFTIGGDPKLVKRLLIQAHTPARREQLNGRVDKTIAPKGHKI